MSTRIVYIDTELILHPAQQPLNTVFVGGSSEWLEFAIVFASEDGERVVLSHPGESERGGGNGCDSESADWVGSSFDLEGCCVEFWGFSDSYEIDRLYCHPVRDIVSWVQEEGLFGKGGKGDGAVGS